MTTPLQRLPDWRLRLDALVYSRLHEPFAWGSNDCALFAADCVQAITGVDLAVELRGRTLQQAAAVQRANGGLAALACRLLGPMVGVYQSRPGDVALVPIGKRVALGVVIDFSSVVGPGATGLQAMSRRQALCAWRVG